MPGRRAAPPPPSRWSPWRRPRSGARFELVFRFEEDLGIDDAALDLVVEPSDLRVPADDLGLVFVQVRLGLLEACRGRPYVGIGHVHDLPGQFDTLRIELDSRDLRLVVFFQLGHEEEGERLVLFHLVADVDFPFFDVPCHFGKDRCALVCLDEAGLRNEPDDGLDRGVDDLDGRRLGYAVDFDFSLVTAARRPKRGQQSGQHPASALATIRIRDPRCTARQEPPGHRAVPANGSPRSLCELDMHHGSPSNVRSRLVRSLAIP